MKVLERIGEQANMRKKVEGYGLKFMHSNWNSNSSNNICYEFEVIFWVLIEVIFRYTIYHFKAQEVRNTALQTVYKSELKQGRYGWLKRTVQRGIKGVSVLHEHFTWSCEMDQRDCFCKSMEINFAWTCEFLHNHAKCTKMMLECCQSIYILHEHPKWIILMQNQHLFIKGSRDSNFYNIYWEPLIWKEDFTCSLGSCHVST